MKNFNWMKLIRKAELINLNTVFVSKMLDNFDDENMRFNLKE